MTKQYPLGGDIIHPDDRKSNLNEEMDAAFEEAQRKFRDDPGYLFGARPNPYAFFCDGYMAGLRAERVVDPDICDCGHAVYYHGMVDAKHPEVCLEKDCKCTMFLGRL